MGSADAMNIMIPHPALYQAYHTRLAQIARGAWLEATLGDKHTRLLVIVEGFWFKYWLPFRGHRNRRGTTQRDASHRAGFGASCRDSH
jgi:hypothetical protein